MHTPSLVVCRILVCTLGSVLWLPALSIGADKWTLTLVHSARSRAPPAPKHNGPLMLSCNSLAITGSQHLKHLTSNPSLIWQYWLWLPPILFFHILSRIITADQQYIDPNITYTNEVHMSVASPISLY